MSSTLSSTTQHRRATIPQLTPETVITSSSSSSRKATKKAIDDEESEFKINRQLRNQARANSFNSLNKSSNDTNSYSKRSTSTSLKTRKPIIVDNKMRSSKLLTTSNNQIEKEKQQHKSSLSTSSCESPVNHDFREDDSKTLKNNKELKNRILILEMELDTEKKKLQLEKENKIKIVSDLRIRFENEKNAALKALEAKLNSDKLEEFNKLKEKQDIDLMHEIELLNKTKDNELLNLKLKLNEKIERCAKLETIIKEQKIKNTQAHKKSLEVIEKFNQELKSLRAAKKAKSLDASSLTEHLAYTESSVQTDPMIEGTISTSDTNLIDKLVYMHKKFNLNKEIIDSNEDQNLNSILNDIENKMVNIEDEKKSLNELIENLQKELKEIKETKSKLEIMYKAKSKSDLDKSAQIKKLKQHYEEELMKFRTEENQDIILHLERELSYKNSLIMEQSFEIETLRSHDNTFNSLNSFNNNDLHNNNNNNMSVASFSSFYSTRFLNNSKKVPVDVIYTSDPDVVASTNKRLNNDTHEIAKEQHNICIKKQKELELKIEKLETQLKERFKNQQQKTNETTISSSTTTTTCTTTTTMTSGTLNSNETNDHLSTTNDRSFEVIEIEKLKAKLNAFSSKLSANTLLRQNSYPPVELKKLIQQSNKEKQILEKQLALKTNQINLLSKKIQLNEPRREQQTQQLHQKPQIQQNDQTVIKVS